MSWGICSYIYFLAKLSNNQRSGNNSGLKNSLKIALFESLHIKRINYLIKGFMEFENSSQVSPELHNRCPKRHY